ncbi:MAG: alpha/beta hydrolase [Bacteroidetes bacterium]|nr:MAG: alpha/beta hydrolase [Bacteroidota bacterium]
MLIYKQYSQAALDSQYNTRLHVPDFATHLDRWESLSRKTEKEIPVIKDISYGKLPLEGLDIYPSLQPHSKTLIFIHGGYWHKFDKSSFQFIAKAFWPYNITTVLLNYPLAPEVSMDQISASCRNAVQWLYQNISAYNGDPGQLYIAGHSAGAHLAAMMLATEWNYFNLSADVIKGVCAISGLYNLIPIQHSEINQFLNMDSEAAIRNSPVELLPKTQCPLILVVGSNETDEFLEQSRELYASWKENIPIEIAEIEGLNHYSIVETMLDRESYAHQLMLRIMKI